VSLARGAFAAGETVILIDGKQRLYLVTLQPGGKYSYHGGIVQFDDIIGQDEGLLLNSSHDHALVVFRPSLAQYVLKMPRGPRLSIPRIWVPSSWPPIFSLEPSSSRPVLARGP
jgi:tRNA (adenine57-N1/adenine58-N1)-methyltransferase